MSKLSFRIISRFCSTCTAKSEKKNTSVIISWLNPGPTHWIQGGNVINIILVRLVRSCALLIWYARWRDVRVHRMCRQDRVNTANRITFTRWDATNCQLIYLHRCSLLTGSYFMLKIRLSIHRICAADYWLMLICCHVHSHKYPAIICTYTCLNGCRCS